MWHKQKGTAATANNRKVPLTAPTHSQKTQTQTYNSLFILQFMNDANGLVNTRIISEISL